MFFFRSLRSPPKNSDGTQTPTKVKFQDKIVKKRKEEKKYCWEMEIFKDSFCCFSDDVFFLILVFKKLARFRLFFFSRWICDKCCYGVRNPRKKERKQKSTEASDKRRKRRKKSLAHKMIISRYCWRNFFPRLFSRRLRCTMEILLFYPTNGP